MTLQVITNNIPRPLIYGYELTEKEKQEFDYIEPAEMDTHNFFKYKGAVYDFNEFMRIDTGRECLPEQFTNWHGYQSDSFFSGILIRYTNDCESVIVASYYS